MEMLYCWEPLKRILRVQRLQNRTASLIHLVGRDHPSAPLLQELHWLPIRMRIQFKILVYVYECRHALAPEVNSFCRRQSHMLLVLHLILLCFTFQKTKTVAGDSAFHAAAPRLWSKLPRNIREAPTIHVFKSLLKTHFFPACSIICCFCLFL